jgi:hypothetical protein
MSMSVGDADAGTGLAGAIFLHLKTLPGAQSAGLGSAMAQFSNALAAAIVPYITSNATVVGTATGAMSGGPGVPVTGTVT